MLDPVIVCHGLGRAPVPLLSRRFPWAWAAGIRRPRTPWLRGRVRALRLRERPGLVASFPPVLSKTFVEISAAGLVDCHDRFPNQAGGQHRRLSEVPGGAHFVQVHADEVRRQDAD